MKRLLGIMVLLIILLSACGDYEGTVTEKKESSFILEVPSNNSTEESIVHEMHLTDGTIFKGSISTFEELQEGDKVKVIPFDVPDDFPYFLPAEVIVE